MTNASINVSDYKNEEQQREETLEQILYNSTNLPPDIFPLISSYTLTFDDYVELINVCSGIPKKYIDRNIVNKVATSFQEIQN